jgi:UV DNA damage endonuclease
MDNECKIHLGLCCLNTELRAQKPSIFNSRTCVRRTYSVEKAKSLALQNVKDLIPMIEYNKNHNIHCFRLSSDIFPRFTDPEVESYTIDFAKEDLKKAGDLAKSYNMRILMHPAQWNQVGAKDPKIFQKTILDLQHHADILDAMGCDNNGVLIVHGGGLYGNKKETIIRWVKNFQKLPENVKNRLVLENCEKCYCLEDVLVISKVLRKLGYILPVVFDSHHYECYTKLHPKIKQKSLEELLPKVVKSWKDRRVLMHVSNQGGGKTGHHSDFITRFPKCFYYVRDVLQVSFDLEVEAKKKEQAIFALRDLQKDLY